MFKNSNIFHERYIKSDEIDQRFLEIKKTEGLEKAIEYLNGIGAKWIDYEGYLMRLGISRFTKKYYTDIEKKDKIEEIKDGKVIKKASVRRNSKFKCDEVFFETTNSRITAIPLSKAVKGIKDMFIKVNKIDIETDEREGKCFEMAYGTSLALQSPNKVVTGIIYGNSDKSKFLHSWVETNIGGKEYVIDCVLNALINKKGYYEMNHVREVYNSIDNITLKKDYENITLKKDFFNGKIDIFMTKNNDIYVNEYVKRKIDKLLKEKTEDKIDIEAIKNEARSPEIPLEMYLIFRDQLVRDFYKYPKMMGEFEER
ncbi:MAG: hypothetical protein IJH39_01985 [Clostridia bacterium]|nr:hypothetical protein [Clostridia bacterium]